MKQQTFLYLISLRTATELITFTLIINKVTGIYGILALLTGYHLSSLQLSMYMYSILVLGAICYLAPHIRKQSPLQCLALAWLYLLDSLINIAYTAVFGTTWFVLLAQHLNDGVAAPNNPSSAAPGGKMMNDTAGFTDPEAGNVGHVDVIATPAAGILSGQDAVAIGSTTGSASETTLGHAIFQSGSLASLLVISALWAIRIYFILIVMAYARGVLRQYIIVSSSNATSGLHGQSDDPTLAENPFRLGRSEGEGWQGKLGRAMTRFGRAYWLGRDDEDEWVRGAGDRFKKLSVRVPQQGQQQHQQAAQQPEAGVGERERRARSGTGPPPLKIDSTKKERV